MNNTKSGLSVLVVVATLGLACGKNGLGGGGNGGQSGTIALGGSGASSGPYQGSGGSVAGGGSTSAGFGGHGGSSATAGLGGANAGGAAAGGSTGGAGGTTCPLIECLLPKCSGTIAPDPTNPCGCPICVQPDGGGDASGDAACMPVPCPMLPACQPGYHYVTPPCGCAVCEPIDAGAPDVGGCPPIACPTIACVNGTVPDPTNPCACPICAAPDAGSGSAPLPCTGLDVCACTTTNGCSALALGCSCGLCPTASPACNCVGKFVGCAPVELSTCASAEARVASLCPQLGGVTFDNLCSQSDAVCATKCLNEVGSCQDVRCSFCDGCDCAGDAFSICMGKCTSTWEQ